MAPSSCCQSLSVFVDAVRIPSRGPGCRERSQRSCLRPGGLPSLAQRSTAGLLRPFRSRRV
ncbi:hypothetical protein D7U25_21075 [Salmonella enterica]|nr:hypothetical protein [Salmonella enterica]